MPEPELANWYLPKPPELLNHLPPEWQWESTRRHPYYIRFWKEAADFKASPNPSGLDAEKGFIAQAIISLLGLANEYPAPSTPFEKLGIETVDAI